MELVLFLGGLLEWVEDVDWGKIGDWLGKFVKRHTILSLSYESLPKFYVAGNYISHLYRHLCKDETKEDRRNQY